MLQLGYDNPEFFFQPFRYQAPMAPHVKRLPAKQNGIGTEVLGNLLCVQRINLLAVFPIEQFGVFRLKQPTRRSKWQISALLVESRNPPADRDGIWVLRALRKIGSRGHSFALLSPHPILSQTNRRAPDIHAAALAIKPDKHEALYNWGYALSAQAETKTGEEADRLFAQAGEKYGRVEEISSGGSAYNQACFAALMGDEDGCRKWLERSKEAGTLPDREHLLTDDDLESVRECQWFEDFLKHAYPENS